MGPLTTLELLSDQGLQVRLSRAPESRLLRIDSEELVIVGVGPSALSPGDPGRLVTLRRGYNSTLATTHPPGSNVVELFERQGGFSGKVAPR